MKPIQFIGIGIGIAFFLFALYRRAKGGSKLELILSSVIAIALIIESAYPKIGDILTSTFMMGNRLFAVMVVSIIFLYALIIYLVGATNDQKNTLSELVRALARSEYFRAQKDKTKERFISVVIPAYNEEGSIGGVLDDIPKEIMGYGVKTMVVVDGARDRTRDVVSEKSFPVTSHIINRGQGDALRTGFEIAIEEGADIVVTMDADGQHLPGDLPVLVGPIIRGEADYVMGSRFLGEYEDKGGFRHLGILLFTRLINIFGGVRITDATNGYRAIRASDLLTLELKEDRFSAPELIMEAARKGLRIVEVPVSIMSRKEGESKKPGGFGYPFGFAKTIIKTWLR